MPWWMTAATGMSPKLRACACEIATIDACPAISASARRLRAVTCPWIVVTTGGRDIPRRPASSGPSSVWSWMMPVSASAS